MSTIYELTNNYIQLQDYITYVIEQDELTEEQLQALTETFESINDSLEDKIEGTLKVIKHIQYDIDAFKAEEDRLAKRRKSYEKSVERLKENIKNVMILTGQEKVKAGLFNVSLRNNPITARVYDESKLPKEFLIEQQPKVDKRAVTAALKNGVEVDGAVLGEQTKSLLIK